MSGNGGKRLAFFLSLLAWILVGLSFAFFLTGAALRARVPIDQLGARPSTWPVDPINLSLLAYAALGGLIAQRRPRNRIGWIFLAIGFTWETNGLAGAYVTYMNLVRPGAPVVTPALLWLPGMLWIVSLGMIPLLLLLFPTGQLISKRWRAAVVSLGIGVLSGLAAFGSDIQAGAKHFYLPSLIHLFNLDQLADPLGAVCALALLGALLASLAAIVLRLVRARGEERLQLKWFTYAAVVAVCVNLAENFLFDRLTWLDPYVTEPVGLFWGIPAALSLALVAAAGAVAVLRYRLYEIDIIIRKTLVYATLTVLLALVYAGSIIVLESILAPLTGQSHSDAAVVISTLAIATLFTPLRLRVQGWIDRRFFRSRYNAEQVLARFSSTARNEVDLEQILDRLVGVISETMEPEQVSLWLRPEGGGRKVRPGQRGEK